MIKLNILKGQIVEDVSNLELRHKLSDANLFMQRPYHYSGMYPTENEM